ncbi:MAG: TonB-dependent receptor [Phaeodactylibacter sp.]|nr:TonB-dependent receptor [Phaeodactylibacter sp.]
MRELCRIPPAPDLNGIGMGIFRCLLVVTFVSAATTLLAQPPDTSLTLPIVELTAGRGAGQVVPDSMELIQLHALPAYQLLDLGNSLARLSSVFIKQYGPGGLASLSYRGGNAAQTSLYWEGFDLNSLFVGQTDLSLIPAWFFESLESTGAGSTSSGQNFAPAGGFSLRQPPLSKPAALRTQAQVGSFGRYTGGIQGQLRHDWQAHRVGLFYEDAKNNFPYRNILGLQGRMPNAAIQNLGLQGKHEFALQPNWALTANWWYQQAARQIPPTEVQLMSVAEQQDRQFRATLGSSWFAGNWNWSWKSALLQEQINYSDSLTQIESDSRGYAWINRWSAGWDRPGFMRFNAQLEHSRNKANGTNYASDLTENRWGSRLQFTQILHQWRLQLQVAPLWVDGLFQSTAGSFQWAWQHKHERFSWKGHLSRLRRLPTFNDRFWQEQGNPELLPETGWGQESSLHWDTHPCKAGWRSRLTGYHRKIDNWILWQPDGNLWRPFNIKTVRSYGLELQVLYKKRWTSGVELQLENRYSWTRSRSLTPVQDNDQSVGKQLIYTPIHQYALHSRCSWKKWMIGLNPYLTGPVYTLADNSMSIPAYWLLDSSIVFQVNEQWSCYLQANNLLDQPYQTIIRRPMPGRNFLFGLHYSISKKPD